MNKQKINKLLPDAVSVCEKVGLDLGDRSQISSFGSAIATGSLLAAVVFFSNNGSGKGDRRKVLAAIYSLMNPDNKLVDEWLEAEAAAARGKDAKGLKNEAKTAWKKISDALFDNVNKNPNLKEEILHCAVALKLALNLFPDISTAEPSEGGGEA